MKHLTTALVAACALTSVAASAGNIVHVANNGVDSATCGGPATPCRSISQGIANAAAGDTLVVRPGRYGDINGNGAIDRPGEEFGASIAGSFGGVRIDKRLSIISAAGAGATIIDMGDTSAAVVEIAASGVTFGAHNAGFTITGGQTYGVFTANLLTRLKVEGNIASKLPFAGFLLFSSGLVELRDNAAFGNLVGFFVSGSGPGAHGVISNNVAVGNNSGIVVAGATAVHEVTRNQLTGNEFGLNINYGPSRISQNYVSGNRTGVMVNGFSDEPMTSGPLLVRNYLVGNEANGVDVYPGPVGITVRLRENNIFGNGNCGTTNQTGPTGETLDARNNFWGAATGPSFSDPADEACPGLKPTLTAPFSTREFDIR